MLCDILCNISQEPNNILLRSIFYVPPRGLPSAKTLVAICEKKELSSSTRSDFRQVRSWARVEPLQPAAVMASTIYGLRAAREGDFRHRRGRRSRALLASSNRPFLSPRTHSASSLFPAVRVDGDRELQFNATQL